MSTMHLAQPVERKLLTPGVYVLLTLITLGVGISLYRFVFGLSSITNLDQQYPWGLWIAIDVATGVALAAGGFTTAALVHVFHREHYEVLVRPALLTALLGYTFVGLGLMVDLGRYYNIWHPIMPSMWQGNSVLFEVGMCVMAYLTVLYIEFLPIIWDRFGGRVKLPGLLSRLDPLVEKTLSLLKGTFGRTMGLFILAGVVLSCMHQSSLGALMIIAPSKVHPLWYTPVLPLLFLMSAIAVGFPMVVVESMSASWTFRRKPEMDLLTPLSKLTVILLGLYIAAKIVDLLVRDAYPLLWEGSFESRMFLLEMGVGVILPWILLTQPRIRQTPAGLFSACLLIVLGVALNRINVFLVAYHPPYAVSRYVPSIWEILVTIGLISALILVYRVVVTYFPVLPAEEAGRPVDAT